GQSRTARNSDKHHRTACVDAERLPGARDDSRVIVRQSFWRRRRRVLSEMAHVVAGVKANDWITQRGEVPVGVAVFPAHAAITRGVHEQGTIAASVRVVEMQSK